MSALPYDELPGTMDDMKPKARVEVDFHLSPDGSHTLTWTGDVHPEVDLVPGDVVEATDGDVAHLAVVDSIEGDVLSLVVLWDSTAPAA